MGKKKSAKIRAEFRKHHESRARETDLTRRYAEHADALADELVGGERVSGKGDVTRKRTVVGEAGASDAGLGVNLRVDESEGAFGRVLSVHGRVSQVQGDDGLIYECATRRLLKSLSTDQRHVVAAGDRVFFRRAANTARREGIIERVEPRRGVLSRGSKGRRHVLVTNVDQLLIVTSAAEPPLKPNLIDRFLVTAEKAGIHPLICVNKVDLADLADLQPLIGVYGQLGYETLLVSARTGLGVERLRRRVRGRQNVVAGQSGVGKSSLLNALEPNLALRVAEVSEDTHKGRHTTTTARLLPLAEGGFIVDTPGIRQFEVWDVAATEVAGYFRDLRPYLPLCRFPDCGHTHEAECAIKDAVADGRLDARRYESYCHLFLGEET